MMRVTGQWVTSHEGVEALGTCGWFVMRGPVLYVSIHATYVIHDSRL